MVHGDLAGWHWQTLSLTHSVPQACWVHHPCGTQGLTAAQLLSKPKVKDLDFSPPLSPFCAQTAQPLPSQDSAPEAYGFPLSWVGVHT